jgi:hypothetical protein
MKTRQRNQFNLGLIKPSRPEPIGTGRRMFATRRKEFGQFHNLPFCLNFDLNKAPSLQAVSALLSLFLLLTLQNECLNDFRQCL